MSDAESTGNPEFVKAAASAKAFTKSPSTEDLLKLYGLFKQSTVGENTAAKPGMFDPQGRLKWEAWTKNNGLSTAEAQAAYIAFVESLKEAHT